MQQAEAEKAAEEKAKAEAEARAAEEKAKAEAEARAAEEAAERSAGEVEEGGIPAPAFARTASTADERAPLSRYEAAAPAHEAAAFKTAAPKPAKKTVKPSDHTAHENEPVVVQDRGNLIFGRGVSGALHKITELVGEIKSVVVEGTIGEGPGSGIRLLEFKSGTKLLTFCISDETDGIACKKFFTKGRRRKSGEPEPDCDEVMAALKEGMAVRVQGSVRFDTFMNEYVLFVNSLAKKEKKSREDRAEVKRVVEPFFLALADDTLSGADIRIGLLQGNGDAGGGGQSVDVFLFQYLQHDNILVGHIAVIQHVIFSQKRPALIRQKRRGLVFVFHSVSSVFLKAVPAVLQISGGRGDQSRLHTDIVHIISYRKSLCQMIFRHDRGHAMPQ